MNQDGGIAGKPGSDYIQSDIDPVLRGHKFEKAEEKSQEQEGDPERADNIGKTHMLCLIILLRLNIPPVLGYGQ
jgi:hypothetical protein